MHRIVIIVGVLAFVFAAQVSAQEQLAPFVYEDGWWPCSSDAQSSWTDRQKVRYVPSGLVDRVMLGDSIWQIARGTGDGWQCRVSFRGNLLVQLPGFNTGYVYASSDEEQAQWEAERERLSQIPAPRAQRGGALEAARQKCRADWPDDFVMQNYCIERQEEAYRNRR